MLSIVGFGQNHVANLISREPSFMGSKICFTICAERDFAAILSKVSLTLGG